MTLSESEAELKAKDTVKKTLKKIKANKKSLFHLKKQSVFTDDPKQTTKLMRSGDN